MLKWLGKFVKHRLNFVNFCSCNEKWMKVGQISSNTLTKVNCIWQKFFGPSLLVLTKFHFILLLMNKLFCFNKISQLPITNIRIPKGLNYQPSVTKKKCFIIWNKSLKSFSSKVTQSSLQARSFRIREH